MKAQVHIRRILCPVDFSASSRHALDHAIAIGQRYEATVTVLHVCAPELDAIRRAGLLASVQEFAATPPGAATQFRIAEGHAPAQILGAAADLPADFLVVGTGGRSGLARLALGSVAETVLRKATCPVLTVPARADGTATAGVFKRILCAIDFSHSSMRALDYAMTLAQEADASLIVLHVIESTPVMPHDAGLARLKECVPDEVRSYCSVETRLARGDSAEQILRVAAEAASDLIVIGIHGRSAADLWFFGSTAQGVVRAATCPELTLRQG